MENTNNLNTEAKPDSGSEAKEKAGKKLNPFAKPITLAEVKYTHFEMREPKVDDMFQAEMQLARFGGGTHTPLQFNGEMMIRQLTKVFNSNGQEFNGPFTLNMLKSWGTKNYRVLRNYQVELDLFGEDLDSVDESF